MADPIEMSALTTTGSILSGDYMWLKRGVSDFKVTIANLFGWHTNDTGNPHGVTKEQLGLDYVTAGAQLKIASNLSDLGSVVTARDNLDVYSTDESDTLITTHLAASNPHNITLALIADKLRNYPLTSSYNDASGTKYASAKAVNDGLDALLLTIENSLHKKGDIIMWHGSKLAFEASTRYTSNTWRICDGSVDVIYGGTLPNLIGRIPRGATGDSTGSQLGDDSNLHSHTTNGTTLTSEQMPVHRHAVDSQHGEGPHTWLFEEDDSYSVNMAYGGNWSAQGIPYSGYTGGAGTTNEVAGETAPHDHGNVQSYGDTSGNIPAVTEVHFIIKIV